MTIKKVQTILNFFLNPKFTIDRSDSKDFSFSLAGLIAFIGCLSFELAGLIAGQEFKTLSNIFTSALSSAIILFIELLLLEALISFLASFPKRKIQSGKMLYFSMISIGPAILFTPIALLTSILGTSGSIIGSVITIVTIIYILFLLTLTIRASLNITPSKLALLFIYPIIIFIIFFTAIIIKLASL